MAQTLIVPSRRFCISPSLPVLISGFYCNIDAAWNPDSRKEGSGWTFKSHLDVDRESFSKPIKFCPSPLSAEALTLKKVMKSALSLHRPEILFLSDSQAVVSLFNTKSSHIELHGVLNEIRSLWSSFLSISIFYIPRFLNINVDALAKAALCNYATLA